VITERNAQQWLEAAQNTSTRELERAVANASGNTATKKIPLSLETLALLERVQELAAQKSSEHASLEQAIVAAAKAYLDKNDPLQKALHVKSKRLPFRRDRGKCQFKLPDGKICGSRQWLDVHHLQPRTQGGNDSPENLITLCSSHHRLIHAG
jgi:hypothetical protein